MNREIKINCTGSDYLDIDMLQDFQKGLKTMTVENQKKLQSSIITNGIIAPFFIWDNNGEKKIMDGHQRLKTLSDMKENGFDIPNLPVVYIQAESEVDARAKLLYITSQYGDFDLNQLEIFCGEIEIDTSEIRLMQNEIELIIPDFKPVTAENQGKLDKIKKKECPSCGFKF